MSPGYAVQVVNLIKHYHTVKALDDVSFQVRSGEVFGILGPNGAGKTTILEILEGLRQADDGQMNILGHSWDREPEAIRSKIGVQLQSMSLYNKITPREALEAFGSYYSKCLSPDYLLDLFNLREKEHAHHMTLSGGQQQRLAIALALVNDPELVFLDEPTTGLDPQARRSLWDIVKRLKEQNRTIILTTHYMEEAEQLCDRLLIMDHGKVLQCGTPTDLIQAMNLPVVVEFEFAADAPDPTGFDGMEVFEVKVKGNSWEVLLVDEQKDQFSSLLRLVERQMVPYRVFHIRRGTLEDVFLLLTGRCLRD
jgi:ABC-2 type transport system ATP-binding protein